MKCYTEVRDINGEPSQLFAELVDRYGFEQALIEYAPYAKDDSNGSLKIKEGVKELFETNTELANIGTQQLYSQYLNQVFPDSKVKDIVYHGTNEIFDKFTLDNFGKSSQVIDETDVRGISVSGSKKGAEFYGKNILPLVVSIENATSNIISSDPDGNLSQNWKSFDAVIDNNSILINGNKLISDTYEIVLKNPEQIHILGSKQDIEGFREFVNTKQNTTFNQEAGNSTPKYKVGELKVNNKYPVIDVAKEKAWLKENIGDDLQLANLIRDYRAFGIMTQAGEILVDPNAKEGTTYHEAFHKVFQFSLTPKEQKQLLKEVKESGGVVLEYMADAVGAEVGTSFSKLNESQLEEVLAEEFRNYQLVEQTENVKSTSFFDKILDYIKKILGLSKINRQELYSNIATGKFKNANQRNSKGEISTDKFMKVAGLSKDDVIKFSDKLITNFVSNVLVQARSLNEKTLRDNIPRNKYTDAQVENLISITQQRLESYGIRLDLAEKSIDDLVALDTALESETTDDNQVGDNAEEKEAANINSDIEEERTKSTNVTANELVKLLLYTLPTNESANQGLSKVVIDDNTSFMNYLKSQLINATKITEIKSILNKIKNDNSSRTQRKRYNNKVNKILNILELADKFNPKQARLLEIGLRSFFDKSSSNLYLESADGKIRNESTDSFFNRKKLELANTFPKGLTIKLNNNESKLISEIKDADELIKLIQRDYPLNANNAVYKNKDSQGLRDYLSAAVLADFLGIDVNVNNKYASYNLITLAKSYNKDKGKSKGFYENLRNYFRAVLSENGAIEDHMLRTNDGKPRYGIGDSNFYSNRLKVMKKAEYELAKMTGLYNDSTIEYLKGLIGDRVSIKNISQTLGIKDGASPSSMSEKNYLNHNFNLYITDNLVQFIQSADRTVKYLTDSLFKDEELGKLIAETGNIEQSELPIAIAKVLMNKLDTYDKFFIESDLIGNSSVSRLYPNTELNEDGLPIDLEEAKQKLIDSVTEDFNFLNNNIKGKPLDIAKYLLAQRLNYYAQSILFYGDPLQFNKSANFVSFYKRGKIYDSARTTMVSDPEDVKSVRDSFTSYTLGFDEDGNIEKIPFTEDRKRKNNFTRLLVTSNEYDALKVFSEKIRDSITDVAKKAFGTRDQKSKDRPKVNPTDAAAFGSMNYWKEMRILSGEVIDDRIQELYEYIIDEFVAGRDPDLEKLQEFEDYITPLKTQGVGNHKYLDQESNEVKKSDTLMSLDKHAVSIAIPIWSEYQKMQKGKPHNFRYAMGGVMLMRDVDLISTAKDAVKTPLHKHIKPYKSFKELADNLRPNQDNTTDRLKHETYIDFYNIGIQNKIPAKEYKKVTVGSQIAKIIMSNSNTEGLKQLVDKYNNIIERIYDNEIRDLGSTLSSLDRIKDAISTQAKSLGASTNLLEAIENLANYEKIDLLPDSSKAENIATSVVRKHAQLKTTGSMLPLVPMLDSINDSPSKYDTDNKGYELAADGSVLGAQVKLPLPTKLIPMLKYYDLTLYEFNQLNKWIVNTIRDAKINGVNLESSYNFNEYIKEQLNNLTDDYLLSSDVFGKGLNLNLNQTQRKLLLEQGKKLYQLSKVMGYRIPTQSTASADVLEVVEYLLPTDQAIEVHPDIIFKTGADFDIDKMSLFLKDFTFENGELTIKPTLENDRLNTMSDILKHPENVSNLFSPVYDGWLSGDILKEVADHYGFDPSDQVSDWASVYSNNKAHLEFNSGKLGVGITALNITNHVLTQLYNIFIRDKFKLPVLYNINKDKYPSLAGVKSHDGSMRISTFLDAIMNSQVDIANDSYAAKLGLNKDNLGIALYMGRLGMTARDIFFIIRNKKGARKIPFIVTEDEYLNAKKYFEKGNGKGIEISADSIIEASKSDSSKEAMEIHIRNLLTILKYQKISVSKFMKATKSDTGSFQTLLSMHSHLKKADNYRQGDSLSEDIEVPNLIGNSDKVFNSNNVISSTTAVYDKARELLFDKFAYMINASNINAIGYNLSRGLGQVMREKNTTRVKEAFLNMLMVDGLLRDRIEDYSSKTEDEILEATTEYYTKLGKSVEKSIANDSELSKHLEVHKIVLPNQKNPIVANAQSYIIRLKGNTTGVSDYVSDAISTLYYQGGENRKLAENIAELIYYQGGFFKNRNYAMPIIPHEIHFNMVSKYIKPIVENVGLNFKDKTTEFREKRKFNREQYLLEELKSEKLIPNDLDSIAYIPSDDVSRIDWDLPFIVRKVPVEKSKLPENRTQDDYDTYELLTRKEVPKTNESQESNEDKNDLSKDKSEYKVKFTITKLPNIKTSKLNEETNKNLTEGETGDKLMDNVLRFGLERYIKTKFNSLVTPFQTHNGQQVYAGGEIKQEKERTGIVKKWIKDFNNKRNSDSFENDEGLFMATNPTNPNFLTSRLRQSIPDSYKQEIKYENVVINKNMKQYPLLKLNNNENRVSQITILQTPFIAKIVSDDTNKYMVFSPTNNKLNFNGGSISLSEFSIDSKYNSPFVAKITEQGTLKFTKREFNKNFPKQNVKPANEFLDQFQTAISESLDHQETTKFIVEEECK